MDLGSKRAVWDAWNASKGPRYPHEKVIQFVFRNFPPPLVSGARALDLGCGSGVHVSFLTELGFDVVAIDPSPIGLRNTATRSSGNHGSVELREALLSNFVVESESFDFVLSVGVFDAAGPEEAEKAVPRIVECLRPGGRALLIFAAEGDFRPEQHPEVALHAFSKSEVTELFADQSGVQCWIDRYITTYENARIEQVDWLVSLSKQ